MIFKNDSIVFISIESIYSLAASEYTGIPLSDNSFSYTGALDLTLLNRIAISL